MSFLKPAVDGNLMFDGSNSNDDFLRCTQVLFLGYQYDLKSYRSRYHLNMSLCVRMTCIKGLSNFRWLRDWRKGNKYENMMYFCPWCEVKNNNDNSSVLILASSQKIETPSGYRILERCRLPMAEHPTLVPSLDVICV